MAHGQVGDNYNGGSMILIKEGATNPIGVKDAKLWAEAPFDELWEELRKPAPQINIDSHDLLNYLKTNEGSKNKDAYQWCHHHYQELGKEKEEEIIPFTAATVKGFCIKIASSWIEQANRKAETSCRSHKTQS
jgi:hypothetical protein